MARDEGYWINTKNEKWAEITEHATWITIQKNADSLELPKDVFDQIKHLKMANARKEILLHVMKAGFIRCRRYYGSLEVHFEFTMPIQEAIPHVKKFLKETEIAGMATVVVLGDISNFEKPETKCFSLQEIYS